MNKMIAIASLVLGVAGLAVAMHAAPQGVGPQIKQSVGKKAMAIAAHAGVSYTGGTAIRCNPRDVYLLRYEHPSGNPQL
jgi:hypothetical protein